jgi:hypothetical protein|tara:strand:- start:423 stop:542 length:120 start_codon:yes stop_codon:yes gene_type:complete
MKGKTRQIKAFGGKNTNLSTNNRKMKRALKKLKTQRRIK